MSSRELAPLFAPRSVVVLGFTQPEGQRAHQVLTNLLTAGYRGPVYLVGKDGLEVAGRPVSPSVEHIGDPLEVALVATPTHQVMDAVRACLTRDVKGVIVYSGGWAEAGQEGHFEQSRLATQVRAAGARLVGPNTLGLFRSYSGFNATQLTSLPGLAPAFEQKPGLTLLSTSTALAQIVWKELNRRGTPVRTAIGLGNCADLGPAEWLDFLIEDPMTHTAGVVLETAGAGGRQWLDAAVRFSRQKPMVVLLAGRTLAGMLSPSGVPHTQALLGDLMEQAGVVTADDPGHFCDLLEVNWLIGDRLPRGSGTVILSNSGGAGALAADLAHRAGLSVPMLEAQVDTRLQRCVPLHGSTANPVDITEDFKTHASNELFDAVTSSPHVFSAFVSLIGQDHPELARAADRAGRQNGHPVVMHLVEAPELERECRELGIPVCATLEGGMRMLTGLHRRSEAVARLGPATRLASHRASRVLNEAFGLSRRSPGSGSVLLGSRATAGFRIQSAPAGPEPSENVVVPDAVCRRVLREYGFSLIEETEMRAIGDVEWYARKQGYPVIVKVHPSEETLRAANDRELANVLEYLAGRWTEETRVAMVEPRPRGDRLVALGINHPEYGAIMALKSYRDTVWRYCPTASNVVASTLERLGLPAVEPAVENVEQFSAMLSANSAITRVELDPLVINPTGVTVAGYRMVIAAPKRS
ncbi:MAG: CoA-binding protein [Armatimonadetes bacterium]|nr:CoA-binding protein [Armatimonadota bacterium]